MMEGVAEERIDVRGDGRIILYKRGHLKKPVWQARIRVPNATGYKVVTTKTANRKEAEFFALNLYEELYMQVKAGGSLRNRTFKQVYDEWKIHAETMGRTRLNGSWTPTLERVDSYALEFFGSKRIDRISGSDFTDYWQWRRSNFRKKQPTNSTLRRERTSIMPVFKFALAKDYIARLPETNTPKAKGERRPTFTPDEWKTITQRALDWVAEGEALATWRDRFMALHCFMILETTGLRIGELRGLRWCDLFSAPRANAEGNVEKYLIGHAIGKTGTRQFVFQPGADTSLKLVYRQRCRELEFGRPEADSPIRPDPKEPIFCHPDGKPIKEYKHSFNSLLKFAGIPIERDGKPRTVYSLRHFYATKRLSGETSPFLLAKQMGTSVEMLEKHYGQVITSTLAAEITKAVPVSIAVKGDIEFPF